MHDYAELIKALRYCATADGCLKCHRKNFLDDCSLIAITDAADAIEELFGIVLTYEAAEQIQKDVPKKNAGKWITTRTWEHDGDPYCSNCGFEQPYMRFEKFKFCPSCGAKMEVSE